MRFTISGTLLLAAGIFISLPQLAQANNASGIQMLPPTLVNNNTVNCDLTQNLNQVLVFNGNTTSINQSAINCNPFFSVDSGGNAAIAGSLSVKSLSTPNIGYLTFGIANSAGGADLNYNGGADSLFSFVNTGAVSGGTGFSWDSGGAENSLLYIGNNGMVQVPNNLQIGTQASGILNSDSAVALNSLRDIGNGVTVNTACPSSAPYLTKDGADHFSCVVGTAGTAGPQGPQGLTGPAGPPGPAGNSARIWHTVGIPPFPNGGPFGTQATDCIQNNNPNGTEMLVELAAILGGSGGSATIAIQAGANNCSDFILGIGSAGFLTPVPGVSVQAAIPYGWYFQILGTYTCGGGGCSLQMNELY